MSVLDEAVGRVQSEPALLARAVQALYRSEPDPFDLIGKEEFTLRELQDLHEQVIGPVQRDAFRRGMLRTGLLVETGKKTNGIVGKPARYFKKMEADHG